MESKKKNETQLTIVSSSVTNLVLTSDLKYISNIEMIISNCGLNTSRIYEDFLGIWSSITKLFHYMSRTRGRQRR